VIIVWPLPSHSLVPARRTALPLLRAKPARVARRCLPSICLTSSARRVRRQAIQHRGLAKLRVRCCRLPPLEDCNHHPRHNPLRPSLSVRRTKSAPSVRPHLARLFGALPPPSLATRPVRLAVLGSSTVDHLQAGISIGVALRDDEP
jgi:hypothetical protein